MIFASDWLRQARVCARLAEDCEDRHLAERLKLMAADLRLEPMKSSTRPPSG